MDPTIGRIVIYRLSEQDAESINRRRAHAANNRDHHRDNAIGVMLHIGDTAHAGDDVPFIVTKVVTGAVNGRAILDGTDTLWIKDVVMDDDSGTKDRPNFGVWRWPKVT